MPLMTIAQAADAAGVSPKMARHYESLGLLVPTARSDAGYRLYGPQEIRTLRIIGRARDLGFPLPSVARMLEAARHQRHDEIGDEIGSRVAETELELQRLTRRLDALRSLEASLEPFDRIECPAAREREQQRLASPPPTSAQPRRRLDRGSSGVQALAQVWGLSLPPAQPEALAGPTQGMSLSRLAWRPSSRG